MICKLWPFILWFQLDLIHLAGLSFIFPCCFFSCACVTFESSTCYTALSDRDESFTDSLPARSTSYKCIWHTDTMPPILHSKCKREQSSRTVSKRHDLRNAFTRCFYKMMVLRGWRQRPQPEKGRHFGDQRCSRKGKPQRDTPYSVREDVIISQHKSRDIFTINTLKGL